LFNIHCCPSFQNRQQKSYQIFDSAKHIYRFFICPIKISNSLTTRSLPRVSMRPLQ
jgi:hypothetical protein